MNRIITTLTVCLLTVASSWARPLLVGHRGSQWGLENSVESFTNGAKKGYEYLETDWKLTKDNQFVCSHDDDTKRLGGTLTLATSTLEELQSETLSQTRSGVKYTGRLCSAKEYLDVCRQYDVRPVIELKWTTGINNNDCSNIPMLIKFIEDNGFRNKCIILTSMKPCLEYIRKNYPDITLQFLTGQYWANHFDWCVQYGMDVDIQKGYFDKETVDKFHDAGLKVNMWTTNDNTEYKKFGDWGCDFITTDYLDPATLPELDPLSAVHPNKVDFPENSYVPRGWMTPATENSFPWPSEINAADVRAITFGNGSWHVLTVASGMNASLIYVVDPKTGKVAMTYGVPEVLADIDICADGVPIGISADTQTLRIFSFTGNAKSPGVIFSAENAASERRITVAGLYTTAIIYAAGASDSNSPLNVSILDIKGGSTSLFATIALPDGMSISALKGYRLCAVPSSRDNFMVESTAMIPAVYRVEREGTPRINLFNSAPADMEISPLGGWSFGRISGKVYGLHPVGNATQYGAEIVDVTGGFNTAAAVCDPQSVQYLGGDAAAMGRTVIDTDADRCYMIAPGMGLLTTSFTDRAATPAGSDADIRMERLWIFSDSEGNAPEHIDGTNAQQGALADGLLYINNCAEKKVHVYGKDGYLGSMTGGAGWGTATDDVGNLIIRDDKLSGTSHTFLIYPAGAFGTDGSSAGEPLKVEVTIPISGQTNFISASGNVLGDLGYIYLFPNKQTAANIIRMNNGKAVGSTSTEVLELTGTAAGYIIPINNNSENFYYQIRNYGIYEYLGGKSVGVSVDRTSTTPPSRNSTGGFCHFILDNNLMYVHNSGANYKGGFTLRNATKNTVIKSIDPIGDKGYAAGGNYSTFNWLYAEPDNEDLTSYTLYQYCPANGIAAYKVYKHTSAVSDITAPAAQGYRLDVSADNVRIIGANTTDTVRVYSLNGTLVLTVHGNEFETSSLTPGAYTLSINGLGSNLKFIK